MLKSREAYISFNVESLGGRVFRHISAALVLTALALVPGISFAMDAKVAAELERLGNGSEADATRASIQLQNLLFDAIAASCAEEQQIEQGQCELSRLAHFLDRTGLLFERCGAFPDAATVADCILLGAEALPIAHALGRDPRTEIDWAHAADSYMRLREALKDAARSRCTLTDGEIDAGCVVKEQAVQLGFPPAAGLGCAKQPGKYQKQRCLDALQTVSVYLSAIGRIFDGSKPL